MSNYLDPNDWRTCQLADELNAAASEFRAMQIISTIKPILSKDGDQFVYLLGENLQEGIAGFGSTVGAAMFDFCRAFWNEKASTTKPVSEEGEKECAGCGRHVNHCVCP